MPLQSKPILTNTTQLSERWTCCTRTVLRICREHELTEVRFRTKGRVFFCQADIEALEIEVLLRKNSA